MTGSEVLREALERLDLAIGRLDQAAASSKGRSVALDRELTELRGLLQASETQSGLVATRLDGAIDQLKSLLQDSPP